MRWTLLLVAIVVIATVGIADGDAARSLRPRVGFVAYFGDTPTPRTLDGLGLAGFVRAEHRLPIQGSIRYIGPTQGPGPVLRSFSREGYDLVIAPVFAPEAIDAVSRAYPHVHFLAVDTKPGAGPRRHAPNVHRSVFRAEQAAYLAGYLAALMAGRDARAPTISAVGGIRFYGVTRWIVGFRAGARRADPSVRIRVDYSNDFLDPAKCRRLALAQIAAGSRVVFDVAGGCGLGALDAARRKHVWGVGVDVDQSFLGPHILTSAVSRYDRGVFDAIRQFTHGGLRQQSVYSLRNGGVQLGRISKRVPPKFLRRLARVRRQIANGTIVVPRPRS